MNYISSSIPLKSSQSELWAFIANPENLNVITPDFLDFKIISSLPLAMYNGLLIEYRVKIPFLGYQKWVTEIKHIDEGVRFVDEQRIGPYRFWYHEHELVAGDADDETTVMNDKVSYLLPLEPLSYPVKKLFTQPMLDKIFAYRQNKMIELFG